VVSIAASPSIANSKAQLESRILSEQRTVLVTGGAGFIGSHVADTYVAQGHQVLVVDDLSSGKRANVPSAAELHVLDIRSPEVAQLIATEKIEVICHHAAQMDVRRSTEDPRFDADVNILGTLNLLEAAAKAGTRKFIFASTGGAIYGEQDYFPADENHPTRPVSPYGVSKLACERYLYFYHVHHGLDVTCLRYANVYGERQNPHGEAGVVAIFLNMLLEGKSPAINGDGLQTRDYVHVSDVAKANLAVLHHTGFETFNLGTGIETSVRDLAQLISGAVESDLSFLNGPAQPGEQRRSSIDPARILEETELDRPRDLAAGLQMTAHWFREQLETRA
jgi:UDP-glucose 4-epimerase